MNRIPDSFDQMLHRVADIQSRISELDPPTTPTAAPEAPRFYNMVTNQLKARQYGPTRKDAPEELDDLIAQAAEEQQVRPELLRAVVQVESGFNPQAVSPAGAQGLMQLMPSTARGLGVNDPFDPAQNVMAGARYLRMQLDRFNGDERLALAAYNAGPGAVSRYQGVPPFPETQRYVTSVLALADNED